MMHTIDATTLVITLAALGLAVGCSDATAGETATYLPDDERCVSATQQEHPAPPPPLPEPPVTDEPHEPNEEQRPDEEPSDDSRPGMEHLFPERPWHSKHRSAVAEANFTPLSEFPGTDTGWLPHSSAEEDDAHEDDTHEAPDADDDHVELIDINDATIDELVELPGVGPTIAARIVEYRQQRQFDDPMHLQRVEGIGPATYEQLESLIRVD